jgi:hypothetical protein
MSLKHLSDLELIESTKCALQAARKAEVEVLRHFREIEERRLWIHAGTLYKYIAKTFHLTNDQIYPRLQTMRIINLLPEVEQKLENGQLNMTNTLKAHQVFSAESKTRNVSIDEKRSVLDSLENLSTRDAEIVLAGKYPGSCNLPEKVKPVAPNRNLVQFYVDDDTLEEIEKLKARHSHQMPEGRMEDLMKILIRIAKRQPEPRRRVTMKPVDTKISHEGNKRSRYVSAEARREMEKSRHAGCVHRDPSGQQCGSTHFLQVDHIHDYSRGGSIEIQNLLWLCGFKNRNRNCVESPTRATNRAKRGAPQNNRREIYGGRAWRRNGQMTARLGAHIAYIF